MVTSIVTPEATRRPARAVRRSANSSIEKCGVPRHTESGRPASVVVSSERAAASGVYLVQMRGEGGATASQRVVLAK